MAGRDLYILQMAVTGDIKIGRSDDVERRRRQLQTGAPHRLRILARGERMGYLERAVHQRLQTYRNRGQRGEWFAEAALGNLPTEIYELIPVEMLEDGDWWKR